MPRSRPRWEEFVSILGTRVLRTEDPKFLTTGGEYTEDLLDDRLTGAAHVFFVRSPVAHARITGIDLDAVKAGPGVVAAYTATDLAELPLVDPPPGLNTAMTQTLLADGVVRYVGEPVAIVVTEDPYQGEDAPELVGVDYEPLPAVVDMRDAARDETLLFPDAGTNTSVTYGEELDEHLFDDCEVVVTRTILNQRVAPAPMESRGAAAAWGEDGRLTAWIPNQGAQGTRAVLAGMLGLKRDRLRVITPDVGGAFGAKFGADPEHALVAWVAKALGRPARWSETRYENLLAMTHGRAQYQTVTIGGRRDGTVLAYRLEVLQDAGAYPRIGALLPSLTRLMTPGTYRLPQGRVVRAVGGDEHDAGRGVPGGGAAGGDSGGGAGDGPVRRGDRDGPGRGPAPQPAGAVHRAARQRLRRPVRQRRLPGRAGEGAGGGRLRRSCARSRPSGAPAATSSSSASGSPATSRSPAAGPSPARRTRTPPSRSTRTARRRSSPARRRTGRATRRPGRCWPARSSASRSRRSRLKWGDTDLIPRGGGTGGSRSLQQGGAAVRQAVHRAARRGPGAGRGRAGGRPRRPALRRRPVGASPWPGSARPRSRSASWPARSGCSCTPSSPRPGRRSRSARTSRWPRSTPRPAGPCCAG